MELNMELNSTNKVTLENLKTLAWNNENILVCEGEKLLPIVVQNFITLEVLMLGYCNQEALSVSIQTKNLTFFSRQKKRLWTKGEISGNFLKVESIFFDCDKDSLIAVVTPKGNTCHTGSRTCFQSEKLQSAEQNKNQPIGFLPELLSIIKERSEKFSNINQPNLKNSYVSSLIQSGFDKCIQKVGEEAVEVIIASKNLHLEKTPKNLSEFLGESADLFFHWLLVCEVLNVSPEEVIEVLRLRSQKPS
jgi:phosphoribosyl-AMP cyclohydrolase / phosphoribosyl-ATP pyrophosphohydrolase